MSSTHGSSDEGGAAAGTPSIALIITAAGASRRFASAGHHGDKLSVRLGEQSVLARSIAAFDDVPGITERLVAISPTLAGDSPLGREVAQLRHSPVGHRVRFVPCGGASRAHTVANAIVSLVKPADFVAIHDGARPLVSRELIARVIAAAIEQGAAAPAVAITSTIKLADASLPSRVQKTIPRSNLWAMQTPQIIRRSTLLDAITRCPAPLDQVTDDLQLLELVGEAAMLVPGEERNLKITTQLDLHLARLLLAGGESSGG